MLFKNAFFYTASNILGQLSRVAQEFIIRLLLPPSTIGIWSFIVLIQNSVQTFDAGAPTASIWYLTQCRGQNKTTEISSCQNTSLVLHIIQRLLICSVLFVYYIFFPGTSSSVPHWTIPAAILILMAMSFGECFTAFLQSEENYRVLSKRQNVFWLSYALLVITGAYFYQVPGIVVGSTLAYVLQLLLLGAALQFKINLQFSKQIVKRLLSFAIPFKAIDYPMSLCAIIDTIFVAKFCSLSLLAIYTTAKLIVNQTIQIPAWMSNVFMVRLYKLHGSDKTATHNFGQVILRNLNFQYFVLLPSLIMACASVIQLAVSHWLTQYAHAIPVLFTLLLSAYFQPRVSIIRNYWIAGKQFSWVLITNLFLLMTFVLQFAYLYYTHTIILQTIAYCTLISYLLYNTLLFSLLGNILWGIKVNIITLLTPILIAVYLHLLLTYSALNTLSAMPFLTWLTITMKLGLAITPLIGLGVILEKTYFNRIPNYADSTA